MTNANFRGKPDVGNLHAQFDERGAQAKPRRESLLYKIHWLIYAVVSLLQVQGATTAERYQENVVPAVNQVRRAAETFGANPARATRRIAFVGNSITRHAPKPAIGWTNDCGMAASSIDRDYVHVCAAELERDLPGGAYRLMNVAGALERTFMNPEWTPERNFKGLRNFRPDIVVFFFGANVPKTYDADPSTAARSFGTAVESLARYLDTGHTRFFISEGFYVRPVLDAEKKMAAERLGATFVAMDDIRQRDDAHGRFNHPSDAGMRLIAERFASVIRQASAVSSCTNRQTDLQLQIDAASAAGGGRVIVPADVSPYAIMANDEWIPVDYKKDIVAGSALDFSGQGQLDVPAGKYGWLRANGPDFEFERRPGVVQRFYGANLSGSANFPKTSDDAARLATRLARLGYNAVRIHHHDRPCSRLTSDGRIELVPEEMDKLDCFLSECFKRGLYATTDLYVSRPVTWRELGIDKSGEAGRASTKAWFYATEKGWTNWCQFARAFLTHRNPYTGRCYAEEPALPLIVLVNEACFYTSWTAMNVPGMKERWREWLTNVRIRHPNAYPNADPDKPPARANWLHGGGEDVQMFSSFYAYLEGAFNRRAQKFLREELGVKAMITGQNHGPYVSPLQEMHEATCDYVDKHFYVEHPKFVQKRWSLPSRLDNKNYVREANNPIDKMGYNRLWSKPFVVSEYNFCGPNEYRAMGGALTGAMAAIQGWGALWRFAYSHTRERIAPDEQIPTTFDAATDALGQSSDRVAMMLYLRGDLPTASRAVAIDLDDAALSPSARWAYEGASWTNLVAWNCRVGTSVRGHAPAEVTRVTTPAQTNAVPPFAVEDRSPIRFDRAKGSFTFETSRSCGGFSEGGEMVAGALKARIARSPALVWATSLDGRPLVGSRRILVSHLTDLQGDQRRYADEKKTMLLHWGKGRSLARRGVADVRLALEDPQSYEVWAIGTDGSRVSQVPACVCDDAISFTADIRQGANAVFHYELIKVK